jgi:thiol-disulfide isomerase/thioredoxin
VRSPLLVGVLAGLLVGLVVLVVLVASMGPATIRPLTPTLPPAAVSGPPGTSAPTSPSASPSPSVGVKVGDLAPPLSLAQLGGGTLDLAALRGRPVWVAFTASWCPSCRDELGLINRAHAQLGGALVILVIDVKESEDTVATLATQTALEVPLGMDTTGATAQAWQVKVLPVHYWVDAQGIVREVLYGEGGPPQFQAGIQSVVPGATFAP